MPEAGRPQTGACGGGYHQPHRRQCISQEAGAGLKGTDGRGETQGQRGSGGPEPGGAAPPAEAGALKQELTEGSLGSGAAAEGQRGQSALRAAGAAPKQRPQRGRQHRAPARGRVSGLEMPKPVNVMVGGLRRYSTHPDPSLRTAGARQASPSSGSRPRSRTSGGRAGGARSAHRRA